MQLVQDRAESTNTEVQLHHLKLPKVAARDLLAARNFRNQDTRVRSHAEFEARYVVPVDALPQKADALTYITTSYIPRPKEAKQLSDLIYKRGEWSDPRGDFLTPRLRYEVDPALQKKFRTAEGKHKIFTGDYEGSENDPTPRCSAKDEFSVSLKPRDFRALHERLTTDTILKVRYKYFGYTADNGTPVTVVADIPIANGDSYDSLVTYTSPFAKVEVEPFESEGGIHAIEAVIDGHHDIDFLHSGVCLDLNPELRRAFSWRFLASFGPETSTTLGAFKEIKRKMKRAA